MFTRRTFVLHMIPAATVALATSRIATAEAVKLAESDPTALALGYKHDASKVDAKKYPNYVAGHNCANCQLYQGKASDAWAPCGAMAGKSVNGKGWCLAWAKKA
ncbi:MAG: hypothetical protein ACI83P_002878 [Janthinobacterium sp.]|jgi:hypothetical protein